MLHPKTPLVNQGVPEICGDTAESHWSIQREDIQRISTRDSSREKRIRFKSPNRTTPLACAEIRRFVEWDRFPAIRIAPLVFLAAIKYSVRGANNGLRHHVVRQTDTRAEIHLIPRNHITRNLAAGNHDFRD